VRSAARRQGGSPAGGDRLCSSPPAGRAPWTLELLADELVRLTAHKSGRTVTVDLLEDGQAEIREGLAEAEMVVARAGAFVREGDRVRPVTADGPPSRQ
jgi:hypothetical protein